MTTGRTQMTPWRNVWDRSAAVGQVRRRLAIKTDIYHRHEFVLYSFSRSGTSSQWRPTCISWDSPRSNFFVPLRRRAAAFKRRCILPVSCSLRWPSQQYVTVINVGRDEGVHEGCSRLRVQWPPNTSKLPQSIQSARTAVGNVFVHCQILIWQWTLRVKFDTEYLYNEQAVADRWPAIAWLARYVACAVNSNAINSTGLPRLGAASQLA